MVKSPVITTPEGTGYVHSLNVEQKKLLKQMWAEIFTVADSGVASIPLDILKAENKETDNPTNQAAKKAGWFANNKAAKAEADSAAEGKPGFAKIQLTDLGLSVDELRPILWDNVMGDHPDALLLRFLRARKWDVVRGLEMLIKGFKWRIDEDIKAVKYSSDDQLDAQYPKFLKQMEMGKFYLHGTDVDNRPVAYLNVRLHRAGDQSPKTLEKLTVYVMEAGRVLLQPPVETVCLVFDLTGFSLSNMDFAMVKYLVTVFEAYYPESLGRILIHGAPFVFWGAWKVIEPWLDPVVASKVRFTRSDPELTQYIPANHLPDKYKGGKDKFVYKYLGSVPGENKCMEDTETKDRLVEEWKTIMWKFEALTREWIHVGTPAALSTRSEKEIEQERTEVAKTLRVAFFKMDPYIRARNQFHRASPPIALPDGSTQWTYHN